MANIVVTNNAYSTLATSILSSDGTLSVTAGQGARFPALSGGNWFYACLQDTSGNLEIVKVTARTVDAMSITRAQEGTSALGFAAGSMFELRVTAQTISDLVSALGVSAGNVITMTNKTLVDASTYIVDDGDNTKQLQYQVSGVSAGTIRTWTVGNYSGYPAVPASEGTSGQVLTSAGAGAQPVWQAVASGQPSVRQTVQFASTDANGYANAISVGSGLAVNLAATSKNMKINFAAGVADYSSTLTADVTGVVSSIAASNISYLYADYVSSSSVTWGKTLAPVQYGYAYNQAAQSCLSLNNKNTDDFGSTWTNSNVTFSNTSPAIAGTYMGVFNGTNAKLTASGITSLGSGSWTLRCKAKPGALPGSGTSQAIIQGGSGAGYGLFFGIWNNAGTIRFVHYLSSNNTSYDIANAVVSATTPVVGTSYDLELAFDAVAGAYRLYVNGVQEASTTSSARVYPIPALILGGTPNNTLWFNGSIQGFEFLPYCVHPAGTTFTPPTTLADVTTAGYASEFFSIPDMTTYSISAASSVAGSNPTFTTKTRYYGWECQTNGSTVTSVTNYALNGRYRNTSTTTATLTSKAHNLGVVPKSIQLFENGASAYRAMTPDAKTVSWTAVAATSDLVVTRGDW